MTKPNVIVFFTDQQRWDSTGLHGNPLDLTPNFDRFATNGTWISNAFTCQPVCAPARSALQTGTYPTVNGVFHNGVGIGSHRTLAHEFTDAGYDTAYIGKWHLSGRPADAAPPEARGGYRHWLGIDAAGKYSDAYDAKLFDADGALRHLPGYRADAYVNEAIDYIASDHDRPFFLFLSLLEPHQTNDSDIYPAPDGYRERYDGRWTPADLAELGGNAEQHLGGYWGMVKRIDEAFGRVLDVLRSEDLLDNTIVVFTSDHGCHFKTRNKEYKRSEHESSIRVPMAMAGPGFDGVGRRDELVSLIDLPSTLLDACDIDVPERMQGSSIMPLLRKEPTDWRNEVYVQISESQVGRALRTERWKYAVTAPDADGWKVPWAEEYVESSLYDLEADPAELDNLIGRPAFADVAATLRHRLGARIVETGEPAPTIR